MRVWLVIVALCAACGGAACGGAVQDDRDRNEELGRGIHQPESEFPFVWREASVMPGGLRVASHRGVLETIAVETDGTARMRVRLSQTDVRMNGRAELPTLGEATPAAEPALPELRFIAAPGGGVAGSMTILGQPRNGEALVAALLPFAWPPVAEWPPASSRRQTIAVVVGGADGVITYRRRRDAPNGVSWITIGGDVRFVGSDAETERAVIGAVLSNAGGIDSAARLAMGFPNRTDGAATEVEMVIGALLPLPEAEEGSLLACAEEVLALRARLDEVPEPPFVLNRPIEDAMVSDDSRQGEGPGVVLDLRHADRLAPLDALFDGLEQQISDRDLETLAARVLSRIEAVTRAMDITARLTGVPAVDEAAPVYLLMDADTPAWRAFALGVAVQGSSREPRLVVRRPTTGPREQLLSGALWPIAERLAERATECPFVANAVAELATRDLIASPAWVRAVVAGGIGTCGCNAIMADELAREVLRWSDVSLQSWGWRSLEAQQMNQLDDDATVGSVFGVH